MPRTKLELTRDELKTLWDNYNKASNLVYQQELADKYGCTTRTVRRAMKDQRHEIERDLNILVYDIETSRILAEVWWTGKQYISHDQLHTEPKIISIAWKWMGEDKVYAGGWDEYQSDEELVKYFLQYYNDADLIIGQNNNRFDNRFINVRAAKYNLDVNTFVKSFDIMKHAKRLFRIPSYSMAYLTKYFDLPGKLAHEGISMWRKVQFENDRRALADMIAYNKQDIIATEAMYNRLRKYMGHETHFGVLAGNEKWSCPNCGNDNVDLYKTTYTKAGTIQHVMKCADDQVKYKISHRSFTDFLQA